MFKLDPNFVSDAILEASSIVLPRAAAAQPSSKNLALEAHVIELFDQLRTRLMRYLLSLGLPMADAEEVLQETFLALFRHLQQGKSRSNLRGWLFRVAHNLGLKQRLRSRRECYAADSFNANHAHEAFDSFIETLIDPGPSPELQFSMVQTEQCVASVVRALPDLDRRCLTLRMEGLRYREIAEVLQISLGSVSMSIARSLARIARATKR